ncbi:hypothetical protein CHUV2995_00494 [Corynebacterium diphtheriae subsp. lausannense]|nr:hypothetical protein CHUV2995_00494 [Corynebacterium diphtheriae subsp. lausannense]
MVDFPAPFRPTIATMSLDLSFDEKLLMMTLFPRIIFIPSATSKLVIFPEGVRCFVCEALIQKEFH